MAFGCLHAGSVHSDYEYFVDEMPKFIERECATILVGAGDFVEGLKHGLIERGEVIAGMNYTVQEKMAARMVAKVLLKVFEARFRGEGIKTSKRLKVAIKKALLDFIYIPGNHDEWEEDLGIEPLASFHLELVSRVTKGITKIVKERGRVRSLNGDIAETVSSKITNVLYETYRLPSGVDIEVYHPHMGRATTTSLRAENQLGFARKAQVVIIANFHTAVEVELWEEGRGQRVALQVGTNKHMTKFESNMAKKVDFGYGCVQFDSYKGRIVRNTTSFCGSEREPTRMRNEDYYEELEEKLGII